MIKNTITLVFTLTTLMISTQNPVLPSESSLRKSFEEWSMRMPDLLDHMKVDNIGPTIMSGRISDIDVNPIQTTEFYIAYASGGLWYTNNNGTTFTPVFDHNDVITIGAIAVDWATHTIYVGTGEANSSRSSYAGNGIYKSVDKGKTWHHIGLDDSHHIGQIWIDPRDANHVIVCALGHLYSPNVQRGIYMSYDAGKTWTQNLFIDENTGAIDLIQDIDNPDVLYATMWHRERRAWNFVSSGTTSGIYKSIDSGKTWQCISKEGSGFPEGQGKGRIGLSITKFNDKKYIYAIIDNNNTKPKEKKQDKKSQLRKEEFLTMTDEKFAALKNEDLESFLTDNDFPSKYTVASIRESVANGKIKISALAEYLEDANTAMEQTEIYGAEVYVSKDDGAHWHRTHDKHLNGLYYTFGYYFGQIKSNPTDTTAIYILGVPILKSTDGGKTWKSINGDNQHGDHHCLWIDPSNPSHLINGNDGGINISYDAGASWIKCNMPSVGQFYAINVDYEEQYNVYGGLQDNGVWYGPNNYKYSNGWQDEGRYPYKFLLGGDGMQVQIDNRDNNTIYTGSQFGNYSRINKKTGDKKYITPKHELGQKPYRWNWQTPIQLSPHNQDILYMGSNKLLRSMDRGEHFEAISGDLTNGGKKGNVPYGTITTIDESSIKFGLIYTGSDDGLAFCTKDGGNTWKSISDSLPQHLWVSRIQASRHKEGRVYIALNGYRWDDFTAYLYVSENYGQHWKALSHQLPHASINCIREDIDDADILYVATDRGLYTTLDGGQQFVPMCSDMPNVPIHDLAIQSKANHLLIGSHGRSIYKTDIAPLKKWKKIKNENLYVFDIKKIRFSNYWGKMFNHFSEPSKPKSSITIYTQKAGQAILTMGSEDGLIFFQKSIELHAGIATYDIEWSIQEDKLKNYKTFLQKKSKTDVELDIADDLTYYPKPEKYTITVSMNGQKSTNALEIEKAK